VGGLHPLVQVINEDHIPPLIPRCQTVLLGVTAVVF